VTPHRLEALHAAAFASSRPWRASEFADLLVSPHVTLHADLHGFALTRTVAGESELLTLAVDPAHHRQGIARRLLSSWLHASPLPLDRAFLEVAADNLAARALYRTSGFDVIATRRAYYARPGNEPVDALVMQRVFSGG